MNHQSKPTTRDYTSILPWVFVATSVFIFANELELRLEFPAALGAVSWTFALAMLIFVMWRVQRTRLSKDASKLMAANDIAVGVLAVIWIAMLLLACVPLRIADRATLEVIDGMLVRHGARRGHAFVVVASKEGTRQVFVDREFADLVATIAKGSLVSLLVDRGSAVEIRANKGVVFSYDELVAARRNDDAQAWSGPLAIVIGIAGYAAWRQSAHKHRPAL
jgi:hypothetical protein